MSKVRSNIDSSFKQKFENFAPAPPEHVWEGVKAGIVAPVTPSFFNQYWKTLTIAAVAAALLIAGIIYINPGDEESVQKNDQISVNEEAEKSNGENANNALDNGINREISGTVEDTGKTSDTDQPPQDKAVNEVKLSVPSADKKSVARAEHTLPNDFLDESKTGETENPYNYVTEKHEDHIAETDILNPEKFQEYKFEKRTISTSDHFELTKINNINIALNRNITPQLITPVLFDQTEISKETEKNRAWSVGFYLSPEMMLSDFDSVEMLTNYSLGIEPTYYFNKHLFIRFGLNSTYSRDRGFASLDYLSYDLLGTYDYVYDITFDSIDGEVIPNYHTYKMGVWDTIRHLEINAITNQYYYIQTPLLVGYYKNTSNIKWYFYGGTAFNLLVSKQIDKPLKGVSYIELLNLQKELPERSSYYFQVWLGAGIEYKVGNNIGIAFEPNYRYYLNKVFSDQPYAKSGLSGLSIRFGLTYTIH